jgi:hypothetical protein
VFPASSWVALVCRIVQARDDCWLPSNTRRWRRSKSGHRLAGDGDHAPSLLEETHAPQRHLKRENISVDLLVTLAPAMQDPIPDNVVRAINYYNSPGWGAPVTADAGYHGRLANINLGGDIGINHMAH